MLHDAAAPCTPDRRSCAVASWCDAATKTDKTRARDTSNNTTNNITAVSDYRLDQRALVFELSSAQPAAAHMTSNHGAAGGIVRRCIWDGITLRNGATVLVILCVHTNYQGDIKTEALPGLKPFM